MIRDFDLHKQIPEMMIKKLLKNAHRAPSAGHTQVQVFLIFQQQKKLRGVVVDQEYVEETPTLIVVCSNTSHSEKRYGRRGREFYGIIDGYGGYGLIDVDSSYCS